MYEPNVEKILKRLGPDDKVLDIGGWARPFNRANYVIDAEPYETRSYFSDPRLASVRGWYAPAQGGEREWFTKETWIQRDICAREPFPFADKEIDFVICSQTLEDLRDPLWVCSEMVRVGKRGYIEVPSRLAESSRGIEPNQVGWSHHRWLIDIADNHVYFTMKYHKIHSHWRFSMPARYLRKLPETARNQWLFWDGAFSFSETTIHGPDHIAVMLEDFVRRNQAYPKWLLDAHQSLRQITSFAVRGSRKVQRLFRRLGAEHESVSACTTGKSSPASILRSPEE